MIVVELFGKELESNLAVQLGVFGFINNTHATGTELLDYPIMGDGLANQLEKVSPPSGRNVRPGTSKFQSSIPNAAYFRRRRRRLQADQVGYALLGLGLNFRPDYFCSPISLTTCGT